MLQLRTSSTLALACLGLLAAGCGDEAPRGPLVTEDGALNVAVVAESPYTAFPAESKTWAGVTDAADDLRETLLQSLGASATADAPQYRITARIDAGRTELGDEGYALATTSAGDVVVTGRTEVGAMYGLYHVAADLGARWFHPEEARFVPYAGAALPDYGKRSVHTPAFGRRGFHHHTQHPIVASDVLLRPGDAERRAHASHLVRYLARNRQNTLSFHLLKTVDLDAWVPYMADIADEAKAHGVTVGCVLSFADQQQNNFKLLDLEAAAPATQQIADGLDRVLAAGLGFVTFQIGTSEFTKPPDADVVAWLDAAVAHLHDRWPGVTPFAWIHIPCDVHDDAGGTFFHLPLQADVALGAWVHTTMFYSLGRPAPVYGCEDFDHQLDFASAAAAQGREQLFFPETAWWLGFDSNLPLALPITGRSREEDLARFAQRGDMSGHVTFTSGREWTFWQYDHYLTRATWDTSVTWDAYLAWLAPIYGERADAVAAAVKAWTDRQVHDFYDTDPLLLFYLTGELPQDELGEAAGILARRPKLSFQKVLRFDDDAHQAWLDGDIARLTEMRDAYQAILDTLPAPTADEALYAEQYAAFHIFVERITHTLTVYAGVDAARAGDRATAEAKLAAAEALTAAVVAEVHVEEAHYRYPAALLTEEKPESLTSYPFGYLWETSTGYFWARRDEQLRRVIAQVFDGVAEAWQAAPETLLRAASEDVTVVAPASPTAGTLLKGFVPQVLIGLSGWDGTAATLTVTLAQDRNANLLPDADTELSMAAAAGAEIATATATSYPIAVYGTDGEKVADLPILGPTLTLAPAASLPGGADVADLAGEVASDTLIDIVVAIAGIDREGVGELLKGIWELPSEEPLPALLPFHLRFALQPAAAPGG
ncbi:MAG: hypothetical protein EP329_27790 [Deltaproteobacteria bacterium]|nr:MAG: hypothetical protein EP329_27790 [Deltaproteobacteria bacterium]